MELPKGYRAVCPKDLHLLERFAEYHRSYTFKAGILSTLRRVVVLTSEVPASDLEAYKKFQKRVEEDYGLQLALQTGPPSSANYQSEIWDLPGSENAEAEKAYEDAREQYKSRDVQGEITSLRRALEIDPKFTRAWLWLGEIYRSSNKPDDAVEAYRQAIRSDPQQTVSYRALGSTLLGMRKAEDAIPVWRDLIRIAPENASGQEGLGLTMMNLKRYDEAKSAFEAGVQIQPGYWTLRIHLGNAYLKSGEHGKALEAYRKALDLSPEPFLYNEIAYSLAEANESLPIALEYAKRAVSDGNDASSKVKLSGLRTEDVGLANNLAFYWDTLGWVYFKAGNLDPAERYLKAAWESSQRGTIAYHLGQVYEAQKKKTAAIRMYRLALNRTPARDTEEADKIRKRLAVLAPGTESNDFRSDMQIVGEVSSLRTIKLPALAKDEAVADFFVIFTRDQKTSSAAVADVKFIHGSEKLRSVDAALKSARFPVLLPDEGTRLLRRGTLACYPSSGCSFTLFNAGDVQSLN